jgi:hypothetical protein
VLRPTQFQTYIGIELLIWFPGLYAACFFGTPTVRIVKTQLGARGVKAASEALQRWAPTWYESVTKMSAKVYGGPHKRALAEWVLLNKVLAPVSFPTKLWIAHKIVERRNATALSGAGDAGPQPSPTVVSDAVVKGVTMVSDTVAEELPAPASTARQ